MHRSYNPYFAGALPVRGGAIGSCCAELARQANALGYHGGEMRLAHEKTTQDELATFARCVAYALYRRCCRARR